jgi:outer membrane lipoprotein-sorting protein
MMNKRFCLIIVCAISFACLQAGKLEDAYANIEKAYSDLTSWQSVIVQTNYFFQQKTTLKSQGNFYYQTNQVAIHYTKPAPQSIIIKDGGITIYDKSSKTAVKSRLESSVQSLNPITIVKTYWQISGKTLLSEKNNKTQIRLKPREDKRISEITFTMDNGSGFITSLFYKDIGGNTVSMDFTGIKANKTIPASVWNLKLPKDIKIINR